MTSSFTNPVQFPGGRWTVMCQGKSELETIDVPIKYGAFLQIFPWTNLLRRTIRPAAGGPSDSLGGLWEFLLSAHHSILEAGIATLTGRAGITEIGRLPIDKWIRAISISYCAVLCTDLKYSKSALKYIASLVGFVSLLLDWPRISRSHLARTVAEFI